MLTRLMFPADAYKDYVTTYRDLPYGSTLGISLKDIDIYSDICISIYISRYIGLRGKGQYMRVFGNIRVLFAYIDISRYNAQYNGTYIAGPTIHM